jgi:hypothetical protein
MQSVNLLPQKLPKIRVIEKCGVLQTYIFWGEKQSRENSPKKAPCELDTSTNHE